jgi:hypothetical protein
MFSVLSQIDEPRLIYYIHAVLAILYLATIIMLGHVRGVRTGSDLQDNVSTILLAGSSTLVWTEPVNAPLHSEAVRKMIYTDYMI